MEFLVITGMSGAGKTQASNILEDMGYYCIDNMPSAMIPYFAELYSKMPGKTADVAFVIDVRGESDFLPLLAELDILKDSGYNCRTVFIDCEDRVLINRYKETRRVHPLVTLKNISVNEALALERKMLRPVREGLHYRHLCSYTVSAQGQADRDTEQLPHRKPCHNLYVVRVQVRDRDRGGSCFRRQVLSESVLCSGA